MADSRAERRRTQRVDARLNLEVSLSLEDGSKEATSLETVNISSSGIYFKSKRYIDPMTKLAMGIELSVPASESDNKSEMATIRCEGIVVRVTPETGDPPEGVYEVAVFFTDITEDSLQALEEHITMLLQTVQ